MTEAIETSTSLDLTEAPLLVFTDSAARKVGELIREEGNPNLPPSTFVNRMLSIREDYADATYYTFQNLLDSHDTKRVLWSLTPGKDNREDKELNAANLAKGKARQGIAAVVQMTVPGTPTIYYGDEVSLTGADDPDDRRAFPWTDLKTRNSLDFDPDFAAFFFASAASLRLSMFSPVWCHLKGSGGSARATRLSW